MFATLTRTTAWTMPWLTSLAVSAVLAYSLTTVAASAPAVAVDTPVYSDTCAGTDDRLLAYAVSTHRVPANVNPTCEVTAPTTTR